MRLSFVGCLLFLATIGLYCSSRGQENLPHESIVAGDTTQWASGVLLSVDSLRQVLMHGKKNLVVIHTGPPVLFRKGHIPGAMSVGQASDSSGLIALKERLQKTSRTKEVLLYCGCCPWKHCPNIRPAYSLAKGMGFKSLKVLFLPTSFAFDWEKKGFPVEK